MIKGETDLGDSVYARAEGNVIWLRTGSDQHIGLLPETLSELFRFAITSRFAPAPVEDPWQVAAKAQGWVRDVADGCIYWGTCARFYRSWEDCCTGESIEVPAVQS